MKGVCYYGKEDVRVETVPDPAILNPRDAIIKVTATAICGSDLHIYGGYIPAMQKGDVLGHEFMGEVVEVGKDNARLAVGDRVVVPFTIACGRCYFCKEELWSLCDNSNPNAWMAEKLSGYSGSGLFGYSHMYGGYPGGQAEYARVPFADVGPIKVPDSLSDEQVLFLSDIFPTGYMAAENCGIRPGDTIAVWGLRAGRSVCHQERVSAWRGARDCHRPLSRAAGNGGLARQGRDPRLFRSGRPRRAAHHDGRPGSRRLH
jgi:threonine dehydrogenase-like Zn-dependent dehydrogenase